MSHSWEASCFTSQGMLNTEWLSTAAVKWRILEWPTISEGKAVSESSLVQSETVLVNGEYC